MSGALAVLWATLSAQVKEQLAAIFRACVALGASLGQPEQQPGWGEPVLSIGAESTAEQVRAAFDRYEALAEQYDGLRLSTLLSRNANALAPSWEQVLERARATNAAGIVAAIESLQAAIIEWNANASAMQPAVEDSQTRLWLMARLSRITQAPEQPREGENNKFWLLLAIAAAFAFGGRR